MTGPATRISLTRLAVVVVAAVAVVAGVVAVERPLLTPAASSAPPVFSPYVDVTAMPQYEFQTPRNQYQQDVTLAFVVASETNPCRPSWGGAYTLDEADDQLQLGRRVLALRSTGGHVRISFGGQAHRDLAAACTDASALRAAYADVVERYDVDTIDLDVEGAALADSAAGQRRAVAIAQLQRSRPADDPLTVWVTLPLGRDGLTANGRAAVASLLAAGVDLAGVDGMAFDFGSLAPDGMVATITTATTALHDQVRAVFGEAGQVLDDAGAWARTGATVMIGQTDVAAERLTMSDADGVNRFAREHHLGLLSMWSLNRDATCQYPLPTVTVVVQTSCSGVDQGQGSLAQTLGDGLLTPLSGAEPAAAGATPTPTTTTAPAPDPRASDDPATSPYPVWDPLTIYVTGMKVVWKHQVYEAAFYSTGMPPDVSGSQSAGAPWRLLGPVMPGDSPAPSPSVPVGTYPQWNGTTAYVGGTRVQVGTTPYVARYWTKGDRPGVPMVGGSPWAPVLAPA